MTRPRVSLRDDRGSLPMVVLVTIIGLMLSALMVPVLLNQDHATRFDTTRVLSLDAAQAGLDVALGKIRASTDAQGAGDATGLPCGRLSGQVSNASPARYDVTIEYFTADPVAQPSTPKMICVDGYGTYDTSSGNFTPSWARITSLGTGGGGNGASKGRTLVTTYRFKTNNANVPGGVIRIFPASSSSAPACLDAGSAVPVAGRAIALQSCSTTTPPSAQQVFVYRTDLTLQLQSSVSATDVNGLCLSYTSPTAGVAVTLAACQPLGSPPYTQQWSFDDNGAFRASLSTSAANGTLSSVCMNVAAQSPSTPVTLANCAGGVTSPTQAWIPAPSVGAGAAALPQWVNYYEFGRCLDITNQNVNTTYLIDYPCKQNPYPNAVAFNQKFTAPTIAQGAASATGTIYTTYNGTNYCLTSPGTNAGYVTVAVCGKTGALQTWTIYNDDHSLTYARKFNVVDAKGLCLGLTAPVGSDAWSAIDVETCVGRGDQKWNADPTTPSVTNTYEK